MARPKRAKAVGTSKTTVQPPSKRRASSRAAGSTSYDAPSTEKPTATGKKMASNGAKKPAGRRGPGRASKKDRWGEEFLTTNAKSPIIDVDLVKLLAHPNAWTCLDEDEKKEILALLPDHIRPESDPEDPNSTIPPISQEFLRYSNNWRDGVRQYQADLQQGRYDPKWLHHAAEAMEERADGKFDKWKEQQFEQFWGQKQKLDKGIAAGESSKVKLGTLVKSNCVKVGDVWKFSRSIKRDNDLVLVEKEVKVIDSDGWSLTFAIPGGKRVFLSGESEEKAQPEKITSNGERKDKITSEVSSGESTKSPSNTPPPTGLDTANCEMLDAAVQPGVGDTAMPNVSESEYDEKLQDIIYSDDSSELSAIPPSSPVFPPAAPSSTIHGATKDDKKGSLEDIKSTNISGSASVNGSTMDVDSPEHLQQPEATISTTNNIIQEPKAGKAAIVKDKIVKKIISPQTLNNKILDIDGRIDRADRPNGNAWKDFRCYRNNQDIGSLWEIRQELFARQSR